MRDDVSTRSPADETPRVTTRGLLSAGVARLRRHPDVVATFLFVGVVLVGVDWVRLRDPVPAVEYASIQAGTVSLGFGVLVTVSERTGLSLPALLGLDWPWLVARVGLELFVIAVITVASVDGLGRLLDADGSAAVLGRYGFVLAVVALPSASLDVPVSLFVFLSPVLLAVTYVLVRLVPFPGRLVVGDGIVSALRRSWRSTRGHAWALLGVVFLLGLTNYLLTSVPVVGPVGSGLVAALHASVVAVLLARLDATAVPDSS